MPLCAVREIGLRIWNIPPNGATVVALGDMAGQRWGEGVMAITNEEMRKIAAGLERSGAREMIIAATAVHLARSLYADSKLPLQTAVLEEMAAAWLREGGRDPAEFAAAAAAVKRADETFQLLQSVPS